MCDIIKSMINYNKRNLNILSFVISIIIFSLIIYILNLISLKNSNQSKFSYVNKISKNNVENNVQVMDTSLENITTWKIVIEKLNLEAQVKEGVDDNNIEEFVGHYPESNYLYGNVSLKAYNTGKNKNYFANLKELELGEEIKYIVNDKEMIYKVISNQIIDNEKEYANKKYENDTITLITYVKDIENKRRCVVAELV